MVARIGGWTVWLMLVAVLLVATGCNRGGDGGQPAAPTRGTATGPAEPSPSPSPSPERRTYTVKSGDTLSQIAQRFDTTVEAIVAANDLEDPDVLGIGDELVIPPDEPPDEGPTAPVEAPS